MRMPAPCCTPCAPCTGARTCAGAGHLETPSPPLPVRSWSTVPGGLGFPAMSTLPRLLVLVLVLSCGHAGDAPAVTDGPKTRDGIGRYFMGREIAHVMGHQGASWLERPQREAEEDTA